MPERIEQDAEDRATQEAARRIQLELASWLATGEPSPKTKQKVTPAPGVFPSEHIPTRTAAALARYPHAREVPVTEAAE